MNDDANDELELTVTRKGVGFAFPASVESQGGGGGSSSSCSLSSSLCCSFHLCV